MSAQPVNTKAPAQDDSQLDTNLGALAGHALSSFMILEAVKQEIDGDSSGLASRLLATVIEVGSLSVSVAAMISIKSGASPELCQMIIGQAQQTAQKKMAS